MSTAEERMQNEIDELEQENRLLRARNDRLEAELMQMQGRELKLQMALNTPVEPVQEPVESPDDWSDWKVTPPAAKQWIGLSDDAKLDLISDAKGIGGRVRSDAQLFVLLDMQEVKLKEKNL
jgi:hypothetical protein